MAYSEGTRLPNETASKLGHLAVVKSDWVKSLVMAFDQSVASTSDASGTVWTEGELGDAEPFRSIWAVDGSFVTVASGGKPPREVSFVKTALLAVDQEKIDKVDKQYPHPIDLKDILSNSAVFHATVFPLKNVRSSLGSNYDAVRHIVRDSVKIDQDGAFYETLKWLAYRKWSTTPESSPKFECPHCGAVIEHGLPVDADEGICSACGGTVFLTDMIGFHLDMDEDSAPDSVASAYMLIMEHLMLFTAVRMLWGYSDQKLLSNTLFIKDGPLTLRSQYSKLVPAIRALLQHSKDIGRPIHIIGQEKSGAFFDHLSSIVMHTEPHERGGKPRFAVLSHDYVRREVYRTPDLSNPYGERTNWGEKVYLKLDPSAYMVLNVPTGTYIRDGKFPTEADLIGWNRILATLPSLVSYKFEGALFPIELANGVASMSSYPSAKILERFVDDMAQRPGATK